MSASLLTFAFWISLVAATLGTAWRIATWLSLGVGASSLLHRPSPFARLSSALAGVLRAVAGRRFPRVLGAFLLDVLLQRRLLLADPVRWAAHLALFIGFSGLLFLHALEEVITSKLLSGYASTQSPWWLLRDLFGVSILVGLLVGAARRRARRGTLPAPSRRDPLFVALLVAVVASGFFLTASKIVSEPAFDRMVAEYPVASGDELVPLRHYWAREFGVVFDRPLGPTTSKLLAAGKDLHDQGCETCHAPPRAAFLSYPLSRSIRPIASSLAARNAEQWLLHLHVLLCFAGLAYLPLGRFFHAVADPAILLARAAASPSPSSTNTATRRALSLDACVRCGLCDARCSVRPLAAFLSNRSVLPSEKILDVRRISRVSANASARSSTSTSPIPNPLEPASTFTETYAHLAEGAYACTECGRCTRVCPVGIDLEDLWSAGREDLAARGFPRTATRIKAVHAADWADRLATNRGAMPSSLFELAVDRRTFAPCVQCQTCTNVCPVVACSSDDESGVDATPQKIMNLLRLGLVDFALGSRMVWDCATCYQCQEHCPSGIRVTDVLYELRQRASTRLVAGASARPPRGDR